MSVRNSIMMLFLIGKGGKVKFSVVRGFFWHLCSSNSNALFSYRFCFLRESLLYSGTTILRCCWRIQKPSLFWARGRSIPGVKIQFANNITKWWASSDKPANWDQFMKPSPLNVVVQLKLICFAFSYCLLIYFLYLYIFIKSTLWFVWVSLTYNLFLCILVHVAYVCLQCSFLIMWHFLLLLHMYAPLWRTACISYCLVWWSLCFSWPFHLWTMHDGK